MNEGYLALYVAIIKNLSPERAFAALNSSKPIKKWTEEDIEKAYALRDQGLKWREVAEILDTRTDTLLHVLDYNKRKKKKKKT